MATEPQKAPSDDGTVYDDVVKILQEMSPNAQAGFQHEFSRDTGLIGDLHFESLDVVQFVVAVEEHYRRRDLPFDQLLMKDGRYTDELRVGAIVDFLVANLNPA